MITLALDAPGAIAQEVKAAPASTATPIPAPETAPLNRRTKISAALITDYTGFTQDPTNVSQSGWQHSQADLRAARVIFSGDFSRNLLYYASLNYNGFVTPPDNIFSIYDFYLGYRTPIGTLTVGKQKETFVYEMVALSLFLPQQERILTPFFQSRAIGAKLTNTAFNQHVTWAAGWYPLRYDGNQVTSRVTGVPYISDDDSRWLHLAVDYRYLGSSNGKLSFQGRPESDVADYYVNTGNFAANYANELNYEFVLTTKPVSLYAEYSRAWVNAPLSNNPEFFGYYVEGSWVLTGETRTYDRALGYGRAVIAKKPSGAWELVARFSRDNLQSGTVDGGDMGVGYIGLNWWKNAHWKAGLGYGITGLTQSGTYGVMRRFMLRLQWAY
jgi:phosphate-selective porin OprO and OprP